MGFKGQKENEAAIGPCRYWTIIAATRLLWSRPHDARRGGA